MHLVCPVNILNLVRFKYKYVCLCVSSDFFHNQRPLFLNLFNADLIDNKSDIIMKRICILFTPKLSVYTTDRCRVSVINRYLAFTPRHSTG